MKKNTIYLILILIVLAFIGGFFTKRPTYKVPEGKVLVTQVFLDSLQYIANLPPVITTDTIYIHDTVKVIIKTKPLPQPDPKQPNINTYRDTLFVEGKVDVNIMFKTSGLLEDGVQWEYTSIIKEITTIIEKPVPYPVKYEVPVITYKTGIYLSIAAGGNNKSFLFGGDLDIVLKNDYIYGAQFRRFGDENIYGVKFGINLATIFKKK